MKLQLLIKTENFCDDLKITDIKSCGLTYQARNRDFTACRFLFINTLIYNSDQLRSMSHLSLKQKYDIKRIHPLKIVSYIQTSPRNYIYYRIRKESRTNSIYFRNRSPFFQKSL